MNGDAVKSVNQSTIDSLKVFLQEMMATVHSLATRHNNLAFSKADIGKLNGLNNGLKPLSPPFPERYSYPGQDLRGPPHGTNRLTAVVDTAQVSSERQIGYSHQDFFSTRESVMLNSNPIISRGSNEGPNYSYFEKQSRKHSMDGLSFQERQSFLEEIKKTLQVWSVKHKSFDEACQVVKGKGDQTCQLVKEKGDIVASLAGSTSVCGVDLCQDACFQCISETPEEEAAVKACYPAEGPSQSEALSQQMPETLAGDACCVTLSFCNGPDVLKSAQGGISDKSCFKEKIALGMDDNLNSSFSEGYQVVVSSSDDKIAYLPSTSGSIVESPDWLPHGWVTELKSRTGGRSAGRRYKCYFDPVSKRRFRTQKEVFCFLRTGNTGRYKPRFRDQQSEDSQRKKTFNRGHKRSHQTGLLPHYSTYNSSEGSLKLSAPVLHPLLRGHMSSDGNDTTSRVLNDKSEHSGHSMYGGMVDIQAAALQLLAQDDDMTLDARARLYARFLPRPGDLYGSTTSARNFKKTKVQGKGRLEALGKVICQQGLSKLRGCTNERV